MKKSYVHLLVLLLGAGCAKKSGDIPEIPPAPPKQGADTNPAPPPAPAPPVVTPPVLAKVWVASNSTRTIAGYDASGNRLAFIDFSPYLTTGAVTAITFISKDVMLAFADPGTAGERIFRIDLTTNSVSNVNAAWFLDSVNFNNVGVYKIVKWSGSKILIPKLTTASVVEQLAFNIKSNIVARVISGVNPWVTNTLGACASTTNQYAIPVVDTSGVTKLLTLSSSTNSRLNLYGNIDGAVTCDSSYNFATTAPASPAFIPTGAVQTGDGAIYVRYQHATTPAIYRYEYNGTTLSNGTNVYSDTGYLNSDIVSRDMVVMDSHYVLLANWGVDAIVKLNLLTGVPEYFAHDIFTTDVNTIAIRPE